MNAKMKYLAGVVDLPYVVPKTGQVVTRAGYNPDTCLYLDIPHDYRPIVPEAPTVDQVRQALTVMMKPWSAYRFADADSAAAMVCAVVTALARPLLDKVPGLVMEASQQACGKTIGGHALGGLMTGTEEGLYVFSSEPEDEYRKRIFAAARDGVRFQMLDNIVGHFKSPAYSSAITTGSISDRVLGVSATKTLKSRSMFVFSSNNCSVDVDMMTRLLWVRIDSGVNPAHRSFSFDPMTAAIAQRRQIAEASCVIWRAFYQAGAPVVTKEATRFTDHNKHCRQLVLWLQREGMTDVLPWGDLGDPAASMLGDHAAADPELEALGDLLAALDDLSGGVPFQGSDVLGWFAGGENTRQGPEAEVRSALMDLTGKRDFSHRSIGRVLSFRRDRVVKGRKLVQSKGDKKAVAFRVVWG